MTNLPIPDMKPLPPIWDEDIRESIISLVRTAELLRIIVSGIEPTDVGPALRKSIQWADSLLSQWRQHLGINGYLPLTHEPSGPALSAELLARAWRSGGDGLPRP